jgi:hypothetical protein
MERELSLPEHPSRVKLIVFYFFFVYFFLYTFPFPLSVFLFFLEGQLVTNIWDPIVLWTGEHILHLERITVKPNGSGDTTWNYVQVFVILFFAVTGSVIWFIVDRGARQYARLSYGLDVLVRYYLGSTIIGYGIFKVIKTQFPSPFMERLMTPYGDSSPMGLLWTFMGYSTAYNIYTGGLEVLGGFLLFFRKTRLLGALLCIGVMSNVVMMNFTYDVPVKLLSTHLLIMAIFLSTPDLKRLLNFFALNRPVQMEQIAPWTRETKLYYPRLIAKVAFIILAIAPATYMAASYYEQIGGMSAIPLQGSFEVQMHVSNNDTLPPVKSQSNRWKKVTVNRKDMARVEYMDSTFVNWNFSADTVAHSIKFMSMDSSLVYNFSYEQQSNVYTLQGGDEKYSLYFKMRRRQPKDFLLMNRGFRWVNEYPFNR